MPASGLVKLWLALAAVLTAVLTFLALAAQSGGTPADHTPRVTAPASEDWNLPKQI